MGWYGTFLPDMNCRKTADENQKENTDGRT